MRKSFDVADEDLDIKLSFPRIKMLCVVHTAVQRADPSGGYPNLHSSVVTPLHVTLFKTISFGILRHRCLFSLWRFSDSEWQDALFTIFGAVCITPTTPDVKVENACNVTALNIKEGGGISRGKDDSPYAMTRQSRIIQRDEDFKLNIQSVYAELEVDSTLGLVLHGKLHLTCYPDVLECFIDQFDAWQPLFLHLDIKVLGHETLAPDLVTYMENLAETYAGHWQMDRERYSGFFVRIEGLGRMPVSQHPYTPRVRNVDDGEDEETYQQKVVGDFAGRRDGEGDRLRGLEAVLEVNSADLDRDGMTADYPYERIYPCT